MRDAYIRFFDQGYISKQQFFEFGLAETIYAPFDEAKKHWDNLKNRISSNDQVFIRGFGRGSSNTPMYLELYKLLLNNSNVTKDPTNNAEARKLIETLTGYAKRKHNNFEPIRNYQISHVFGRTKNVYAFTAPWNIVYTPKLLDPLTGHEAKGDFVREYTELFQRQAFDQFRLLIEDYNRLVTATKFCSKLSNSLNMLEDSRSFSEKEIRILRKSVNNEFQPIILD